VNEESYETVVKVVERNGTKHLQTTSDGKDKNNLGNLPDC